MTFEQLVPIAKAAVVAYPALTVPQLLALWWVESRWDPAAVNGASLATGLGQVMPQEAGFADRPTIEELKDPATNADWSARILASNLARANGDLRQAVKWYSGGWASSGDEAFEATYWQPFLKKLGEMTKLCYKDGVTMDLSRYPRPANDTGAGYHMGANAYHPLGDNEGLFGGILDEFYRCGLRWAKLLDAEGSSYNASRACLEKGIMPVVRLYRYKPYPGRLTSKQKEAAKKLYDVGVRYFERGNEPNLWWEWASDFPGNDWNAWTPAVFDRLAADWLADAEYLAGLGAYVALDALAGGGDMDDVLYLRGFLAALQRAGATELLRQHGWIACHPAGLNHPLDYPEDARNRQDHPGVTILSDVPGEPPSSASNCIRKPWKVQHEFEQMFGFQLPLLATEGGFWVGNHADARYAPLSVQSASDLNYIHLTSMASAPEWYIASMPWLWSNRLFANPHEGFERDAVKRIPGWGNCPADEPAVLPLLNMLLEHPCQRRGTVGSNESTEYGGFTVLERQACLEALAVTPATIKRAVEKGYVWLKELYKPGDPFAFALCYDPAHKRYRILKIRATDWSVVAETVV